MFDSLIDTHKDKDIPWIVQFIRYIINTLLDLI